MIHCDILLRSSSSQILDFVCFVIELRSEEYFDRNNNVPQGGRFRNFSLVQGPYIIRTWSKTELLHELDIIDECVNCSWSFVFDTSNDATDVFFFECEQDALIFKMRL